MLRGCWSVVWTHASTRPQKAPPTSVPTHVTLSRPRKAPGVQPTSGPSVPGLPLLFRLLREARVLKVIHLFLGAVQAPSTSPSLVLSPTQGDGPPGEAFCCLPPSFSLSLTLTWIGIKRVWSFILHQDGVWKLRRSEYSLGPSASLL